jgi:hypothetical protein
MARPKGRWLKNPHSIPDKGKNTVSSKASGPAMAPTHKWVLPGGKTAEKWIKQLTLI